MIYNTQMDVIENGYQGEYKRVLCVCSAGCLRSPTAAVVLSQEPYNFNTRCAGVDVDYAIIPVTEALLTWADEIVCMSEDHADDIRQAIKEVGIHTFNRIIVLNIPDEYEYRDPELISLIKTNYDNFFKEEEDE